MTLTRSFEDHDAHRFAGRERASTKTCKLL